MKRNNPLKSRKGTRKNPTRKKRRNPSDEAEFTAAAKASEDFHGVKAHELIRVTTDVFEHDNLADLGELVSMEIKPINGGRSILLSDFDGARLAQSPKGYPYQLYIEGGDQSVDLGEFGIDEPHESEVLGKLVRIIYFTDKKHLGRDGGIANYKHRLGEVSGVLPYVNYDCLNKLLSISGGAYKILPEGIDD